MIFLHGGGDHPESREVTFGRFVSAATAVSGCRLAMIVVGETKAQANESYEAYRNIFTQLASPPDEMFPVLLFDGQGIGKQLDDIDCTAVFVCGGMTPLYGQMLCQDLSWLEYVQANKLPYGGTSAGAAIASEQALLGGWLAERGGTTRDVIFRGASEGLDPITVKSGLGLVRFTIDVHASQMGTLTRLIHAVEMGLTTDGWAIDENTAVFLTDNKLEINGRGQAYHVWSAEDGQVCLTIHTA